MSKFFCKQRVLLEKASWIFDLDLSTKEKVSLQGIQMWNMKALSLTIQKLWPVLKFFFFFLRDLDTKEKVLL